MVYAILLSPTITHAQENTQSQDTKRNNVSGTPARAPDPVAGVDSLLVPSAQTLASAATTFSGIGGVFRATVVPLLAFDANYIPILSETKISLSTDTSNSLTQISIGFSENPFALRSARGLSIIKSTTEKANCGIAELELEEKLRSQLKPLEVEVANAGAEITKAEQSLIAANTIAIDRRKAVDFILASDAKDRSASFQRAEDDWLSAVADIDKNKGTLSELTIIYDKKKIELLRATAKVDKSLAQLRDSSNSKKVDLPDGTAASRFQRCYDEIYSEQWRRINSTFRPQIGLSLGVDIYPWGSVPDPKDQTGKMTANLEPFGGVFAQLYLSFHINQRFGIDLHGTYKHARSSGSPHTKLSNTYGGGLLISGMVFSFMDNSNPGLYPEYIKSGFMPGIVVGASGQISFCDGKSNCAKSRTNNYSVTPFIDFRIKPELQFRISLPITFFNAVDKVNQEIAPTFSLTGSISAS